MGATTLERPLPARPAQATGERWRAVAVVAVPAALAAVLAFVGLTARSLGFDEGASVTIAAQHGHALGHALAHDGGNMSGYYLVLHAVTGLFGRSLLVIRLPSVVAAVATVALVGALGLRLFDRRVALFAGLLAAVSLPLIFWGQSARGYAPMVALVTASWLSFVSGRRLAYVVTTVLAVYMSFVAVLAVAAQLIVWRRRDVRPLLACAAGCVPLVVLALERGSGQLFWVPRPSLHSTWQVLQTLASAGLPPSFRVASAVTIVLTVLTAALLFLARRPGTRLLLSWLLVPVALALVESLIGQSIFLPRNLLVALPAVALLLAVGLTHPRVPGPAVAVLLGLLIALRAVPLASAYGVSPEAWNAATAYVREHARPSDCIAFYPADARMAFAYYGRAGRPVLPSDPWGPRAYVEDYWATPRLAGCPRVWLVSSHEGQPSGPAGSRANYARFLALRASLRPEYPLERDARFGYAAAITVRLLSRP